MGTDLPRSSAGQSEDQDKVHSNLRAPGLKGPPRPPKTEEQTDPCSLRSTDGLSSLAREWCGQLLLAGRVRAVGLTRLGYLLQFTGSTSPRNAPGPQTTLPALSSCSVPGSYLSVMSVPGCASKGAGKTGNSSQMPPRYAQASAWIGRSARPADGRWGEGKRSAAWRTGIWFPDLPLTGTWGWASPLTPLSLSYLCKVGALRVTLHGH